MAFRPIIIKLTQPKPMRKSKFRKLRLQLFSLFLFIIMVFPSKAQDSSYVLSPADFLNIVRTFHPVIKQADITVEKARAGITIARGEFDPYFYLNTDQKTFDGKNYFRYTNPELKIPTWYGIEVKAGLENNGGDFLNSEVTPGKTSYAGISVPLAKNLVMDKRRAALRQAGIFKNQSMAERDILINDILLDAYYAYWNWVQASWNYEVITNTVKVNETRFRLVKMAFQLGDRPAIDTTEALAQLEAFRFMESESKLRLNNSALELSNFLWKENNEYYELPALTVSSIRPEKSIATLAEIPDLMSMLETIPASHPKLRFYNFKLSGLEVDRKLKFQELLPTVNLRTNILNKGYNVLSNIQKNAFYENNNKFGIEVGIPLRFSKGRGEYKMAKLKIKETNLEVAMLKQQLINKTKFYFNELTGLQQQVKQYESVYNNYQLLLKGEELKFRSGESSLFLLNNRENKVLETSLKLNELKIKFLKSQASLQWAAGLLK